MIASPHPSRSALLSLSLIFAVATPTVGPAVEPYEKPPIAYSQTLPTNLITRLEAKWQANFPGNSAQSDRQIVQALLRELNISPASQLLVYSKTSLQRSLIDPRHPRAIYFNDDCYIGWCPGGLVEVAIMDPQLGPVFYAFKPSDLRRETPPEQPYFQRDANCLSCHGGHFVRGIPSVFARSVPTDREGEPLLRLGSQVVTPQTPFKERWGGWYVTGQHGETRHAGNLFSRDDNGQLAVETDLGLDLEDLTPFVDMSRYLSSGSDVVALMIFEHQLAMHNALTRAAFDARRMMDYQQTLQRELKEPITEEPVYDSVVRVLNNRAQEVVDELLFRDEANLPRGGIDGDPAFQKAFLAQGRRCVDGHSLRDLDLDNRLFKNRCSFLIHSANFHNLPPVLKRMILDRLAHALHPTDPDERYYYLKTSERARISRILKETLPGFLSPSMRVEKSG